MSGNDFQGAEAKRRRVDHESSIAKIEYYPQPRDSCGHITAEIFASSASVSNNASSYLYEQLQSTGPGSSRKRHPNSDNGSFHDRQYHCAVWNTSASSQISPFATETLLQNRIESRGNEITWIAQACAFLPMSMESEIASPPPQYAVAMDDEETIQVCFGMAS